MSVIVSGNGSSTGSGSGTNSGGDGIASESSESAQVSQSDTQSQIDSLKVELDSLDKTLSLLTSMVVNQTSLSAQSSESASEALPSTLDLSLTSGIDNLNVNTLLNVLGDLKVSGKTNLADTTIGGKLTVGLLTIDDSDSSINTQSDTLKIQNNSLSDVEFFDGKILLTSSGSIKAVELTAEKATIEKLVVEKLNIINPKSVGIATIKAGDKEMLVDSDNLGNGTMIFLTVNGDAVSVSYEVVSKNTFKIKLEQAQSTDTVINWLVINSN